MSLNAVIGNDGIVSKAMDANEKMKLAQIKEELDYMFFDYNVEFDNERTISEFLNSKVASGDIDEFKVYPIDGELMMVISKDEYYNATQMETSLSEIQSGFTVVTEESFADLEDGSLTNTVANVLEKLNGNKFVQTKIFAQDGIIRATYNSNQHMTQEECTTRGIIYITSSSLLDCH